MSITTTDGRTIEGAVAPADAQFQATTSEGQTVTLRLEKLPPYEKQGGISETIERVQAGYVIRAPWYTAVVKRLWENMPLRVGQRVVNVPGELVNRATVRWVEPADKPQQGGGKR